MPLSVPGGGFFTGEDVDRIIGDTSGLNQVGDHVFFANVNAGDLNSGDQVYAIGQLAAENNTADNVIAFGLRAAQDNVGTDLIAIGNDAGNANASTDLIAIGHGAADAGIPAGDVTGLIAIGTDAAGALAQTNAADHGLVIGFEALAVNPGGANHRDNTIIGSQSFSRYTDFSMGRVTSLGARAGFNWTTANADTTMIGALAGGALTVAVAGGGNNTGVGSQCLEDMSDGQNNTAVGKEAGTNLTTGDGNCFFGTNAGDGTTTQSDNIAIGDQVNSGGARNVVIGDEAGNASTTWDVNTFIGANVMQLGTPGDNNVAIGAGAGNASFPVNGADFLAIETRPASTLQPLIWGDFASGNLKVGGLATNRVFTGTNTIVIDDGTAPSGAHTTAGILYVTAGALNYRGSAGTITALAVA